MGGSSSKGQSSQPRQSSSGYVHDANALNQILQSQSQPQPQPQPQSSQSSGGESKPGVDSQGRELTPDGRGWKGAYEDVLKPIVTVVGMGGVPGMAKVGYDLYSKNKDKKENKSKARSSAKESAAKAAKDQANQSSQSNQGSLLGNDDESSYNGSVLS